MKTKAASTENETLTPTVKYFDKGQHLAALPANFDEPFLNPKGKEATKEEILAALDAYVKKVIDPDKRTDTKITLINQTEVYGKNFETNRAVIFSFTTTKGGELRIIDFDGKHEQIKLTRGSMVAVEGYKRFYLNLANSPARIVAVIEY